MLFRCVAAIPNSGGKCLEYFYEDTPEGRAQAEAWAREHDRPGMGVYDCVSALRERRRIKPNVAQIYGLHVDIDAYKSATPKDDIIKKLNDSLMQFSLVSRINSSGRGIHVHCTFREPIEAGTPEAERAEAVLRRLVAHLGADPQPAHFVALMRRVGTTNSKEGGGPCETLLDTGAKCELSDIEAYLELVEGREPPFVSHTEPAKQNGGGNGERTPVDIEAEYAAMKPGDESGHGVNATHCRVVCSLIWKAWHPDDITDQVVDATLQAAERQGLKWDRGVEEEAVRKVILSMYHTLFEPGHNQDLGAIPVWLPMEFHERWTAALADGKRPTMSRNGAGWHIRAYGAQETNEGAHTDDGAADTGAPKDETPKDDAPKAPFILRPFEPFDAAQLPPREFLFGKHYQRRTVSGTVAPGGTGKSSLVMVESIAMATGRNLLDEEVRERVRVWYHNGEDNMVELQRRLAGICQHYEIPMEELRGWFFMTSGNEVPLRVAESWSQVRLNTDHRLVKCITEAIGDNKIDVANLDPLVTLHGVQENSPGQMDGVIRIFTRMADTQNCAIDLSHHTRKLLPGAAADDYTVDDMRGARSISDAMRAVRLLNFMSPQDAENAGLMEIERTTYFRIDRAKANYSAPSKTATWRRFVNVDLPNTDAVGVVVPWQFPGQDGTAPSPEKLEAERKAEHVFLETLRRLFLAGRFVAERGAHNAPHVFAKEREAKLVKVGKAALADAMRRLFDKGKIRQEEYMKSDRHVGTRIVEL
jgi:RecA-family ATPase